MLILSVSFVADLVFLEILPRFKIQDFVFILAFLLPWRVIRVVNSLVVAVQTHEHFRLKLLYSRKKKTQNSLREAEVKLQLFRAQCCALKHLCLPVVTCIYLCAGPMLRPEIPVSTCSYLYLPVCRPNAAP
ncbi:hypothetical protein V1264_002485 [Littorina saxatilis]|uniref:Voltage-gated hydrogen channel 1 n=1 Tax=Littorina saxatilis TaxID=31220 RepID=A0AAN9B621_9CAEN